VAALAAAGMWLSALLWISRAHRDASLDDHERGLPSWKQPRIRRADRIAAAERYG